MATKPKSARSTGRERAQPWWLLPVLLVLTGPAAACGMHGFGFSPFASAQVAQRGPALPPGTRLDVEGFVAVVPGASAELKVSFATPEAFRDPALTLDVPERVHFEGSREPPLPPIEGTLSMPFVAEAGYHWLTLTLHGTVDGEAVSLVRRVYVTARSPGDIAAR
ncbi:MAG: hypothetical protein ACX93N_01550 [Pseudohaliea sp.]